MSPYVTLSNVIGYILCIGTFYHISCGDAIDFTLLWYSSFIDLTIASELSLII